MRTALHHSLLLALLLGASACGAPAADPLDGLRVLEGSWVGTHRVLGDDAEHAATYEIHRAGETLVWEFQSAWGGGFSGRGVQQWDPLRAQVVERWTDSSAPEREIHLHGAFDPDTGFLVMRSEEPAADGGAPTAYLHTTRILAPDAWSYVMRMIPPGGAARDVVWIEMRRE